MALPPSTPGPGREAEVLIRSIQVRFDSACRELGARAGLGAGEAVVLGCSAGGDSMALLDLAAARARTSGGRLCVAHFDHAQRAESAAEAEFVAGRCAELGVACHRERWGGADDAAGPPARDEASMREARLEWFGRVMAATGSGALMLAHQADDRAETFLMRLLRGSGPTGLASIRPVEQLRGLRVLRPLLEFRREELRRYLGARGTTWCEDASNEDERYDRVWIRRRILPLLNERMGADVAPRLVRASRLAEEESRALAAACEVLMGRLAQAASPPALAVLRLDEPAWTDAPTELRAALLRHWLWKLREGVHPPGYETVREAVSFAERGAPGTRHRTVELIELAREAGCLVAYPPRSAAGEARAPGG